MSFQSLNEFYKEVEERHRDISLGKNPRIKGENKYYLKVTRRYLKNFLEGLNANEKMVMIALDLHKNKEGIAFPSQKIICELSGLPLTTLKRTLTSLKKSGRLTITPTKGRNNLYIFPSSLVKN